VGGSRFLTSRRCDNIPQADRPYDQVGSLEPTVSGPGFSLARRLALLLAVWLLLPPPPSDAASASLQAKFQACSDADGPAVIEACSAYVAAGRARIANDWFYTLESLRLGEAYLSAGQPGKAQAVLFNVTDQVRASKLFEACHRKPDCGVAENYIAVEISLGIAYFNLGDTKAAVDVLNSAQWDWNLLRQSPSFARTTLDYDNKIDVVFKEIAKAHKESQGAPTSAGEPAPAPKPIDACQMFPNLC
jgi:hypothetical protein